MNISQDIGEKLEVLGEFVAYREIKEQNKTSGGLMYDNSQIKNPVKKGVVVAVGKGIYSATGEMRPMTLKPGDIILYKERVGHQWLVPGEDEIWFSIEAEILSKINE